jgi:hypothetical protein
MQLKTNTAEFISEHEAILQVLEDDDIPGVESGLSTIPGKPIPYALLHPSGGFLDKNMDEVLDGIAGKIVGTMGDAWIDYTGRPKLKAKFSINDPDIEQKIKDGDVLISDAFWQDDYSPYISSFEFDHMLIYPRASNIPQGEPAAIILNQMADNMDKKTDEPTSLEFARALLTQNQGELDTKKAEILTLNQKIAENEGIIAQKDQVISERDTLITNQTKEIEGYQKQLADIEAAEELKVNQALFETYAKGVQDKFESRKSELGDPKTSKRLILEMNQEQAKVKVPEFTKAEGTQFATNQSGDDVAATQSRLSGTRMKVNYNEEVQ